MTTITDALGRARSEAQELHKQIEANTAKNHAALKADIQEAGVRAKQLASSLKATADGQRADAKHHVKDAISKLEDLAKHAHDVASAGEAQLKEKNLAMLEQAGSALRSLSQALAADRSKAGKA